jgi:hypothetical protein
MNLETISVNKQLHHEATKECNEDLTVAQLLPSDFGICGVEC